MGDNKDRAAFEAVQTAPKHPDDSAVDRFAERMKWKLSVARLRGRSGWQDRTWTPEQISAELHRHVAKGDPLDVANYCMFLYERCEPITPREDQAATATAAERERAAKVCEDYAADRWSLYKGLPPYTGKESGRADQYTEGCSDGADVCADKIRSGE